MKEALALAKVKPLVIDYDDPEFSGAGERLGTIEYEDFIAAGDPGFAWKMPGDEWDAITLNYTSGTTGDPKGVVYHHRGAYLLAIGNVLTGSLGKHCVYLWTLPMFHCNGWCFPWTISVVAGTHVCLRQVRAPAMYDAIADHKVTHLCGAPIVMATLLNAPAAEKKPLPHVVEFFTAAAPPPEAVLAAMKEAGFNVTHVYGLTETYGPATTNEWRAAWDALSPAEQAAKKARQGVRYVPLEALDVRDPDTLAPVPWDGESMGEVMFRGNVVMKGYLKNKSGDREGVRRRLVSLRRPRRDASRRLYPAQGPLQGHHHLRRREHLLDRGGGRPLQASGGAGRRRGGEARRQVGRNSLRLRRAQAGARGDDGRPDRLVQDESRGLQMPALRRVRGIAEDVDGEDSEIQAAGDGEGGVSAFHNSAAAGVSTMNKEQASEIQRHGREAAAAIGKIEKIVLGFTKEERSRLASYFDEIYTALQFGILQDVYDRFPDLRDGREEVPKVSSFLRWEDVSLPAGISEADLDELIFAVLTPRLQKTAMVIAKTKQQCAARAVPVDAETIGARILALAELGRIDSAGDPSMWRHSEVRLKQE